MTETLDSWPAGATWVFQGTVAEDATAGTHICTLTVTPGAGSEMTLDAAMIIGGNTATSQTMTAFVDDGTNIIYYLGSIADTTANVIRVYPHIAADAAGVNNLSLNDTHIPISGGQRLVLRETTAAVSVTQTFSVQCRIKGALPTAVLNDTIGTSTNTVNTNKVF